MSSDLDNSWWDQEFAPQFKAAYRLAIYVFGPVAYAGVYWENVAPEDCSMLDSNYLSQIHSPGKTKKLRAAGRNKELTHIRPPWKWKPWLPISERTTRHPLWGMLALPVRQFGLESQLNHVLVAWPWVNNFSTPQFSLLWNGDNDRFYLQVIWHS